MGNKIYIWLFVLLFPVLLSAQDTLYCSPSGNDNNAGTFEAPFATWNKLIVSLTPGDVGYVRGGRYMSYHEIGIDPEEGLGSTGYPDSIIRFEGYPPDVLTGNKPILDCKNRGDSVTNPYGAIYHSAMYFAHVQFWDLRHFDIRNVYQLDTAMAGAMSGTSVANFNFENIHIDTCGQRGWWWRSGAWSYADSARAVDAGSLPEHASPMWDYDTTTWLNCDVSNLYDSLAYTPGNAADGWKTICYHKHQYTWENCRAWNYSDDGWDPNGGKRIWRNCWAMSSTKYDGLGGWDIEGNGFKLSSYDMIMFDYLNEADSIQLMTDSMIIMEGCLAIYNKGTAFSHGHESDTSNNERLRNCTAYKNGNGFLSMYSSFDTIGHSFKNCLGYGSTAVNAIGQPTDCQIAYTPFFATHSTFEDDDGGYGYTVNPNYTVTDADFVSVDSLDNVRWFTQARAYDGSMDFDTVPVMLASTSDLIDGGIDWGGTYVGTAPDVGYNEYTSASSTPPVAGFSGTPLSLEEGNSVSFTDESTNVPTSWLWTFEGGTPTTSTAQNPTVTYNTAGNFNVTLQATNGDGSDTEIKTDYITVTEAETPAAPSIYRVIIQ